MFVEELQISRYCDVGGADCWGEKKDDSKITRMKFNDSRTSARLLVTICVMCESGRRAIKGKNKDRNHDRLPTLVIRIVIYIL